MFNTLNLKVIITFYINKASKGIRMNGNSNGSTSHNHLEGPLINDDNHVNPENILNGQNGHTNEVIMSKFAERYTLFLENEQTYKNIVKEHVIETPK